MFREFGESRIREIEQELCEQILKLEKQLMDYRKADFENILADNYREFGSSGTMYDKLIQLNSLENEGGFQNIPFVVSDFAIQQCYILYIFNCKRQKIIKKLNLGVVRLRVEHVFSSGNPTLNARM